MILLKTLLESVLDSKRGNMTISVGNNPPQKYRCLLSHNTNTKELPYRLTIFRDDMTPLEHYAMGRSEYEEAKKNNVSPRILQYFDAMFGTIKNLTFDFN